MPTKIEARLVEAPGGGVMRHVNPRHVPDQNWANARNVRFPTGGARIRSTDGYQQVDRLSPAEPIVVLWWYVNPDSSEPALVTITTKGAWFGPVGLRDVILDYGLDTRLITDIVTIDQYKKHLIWADGRNVYTWPGTGPAIPLGVAGPEGAATMAPIGKLVEIHRDHVLIGHITEDPEPTAPGAKPWRVAYSKQGDPFDWTSDEAGDIDFLDDSTGITALKVLGDHCIVHKPNRLARMLFIGPPEYYITEGIPADDGAISARAPLSIGAYQFYMGRTNFYRLAAFAEPIGDSIWPEVADAIDWTQSDLIYAYRRLEYDEICWKIPTLGSAQPSLTIVYNYRDQTWSLTDHDPALCFTEVPGTAVAGLAPPLGGTPPPVRGLFATVDGLMHVYGGKSAGAKPIHAWAESRHFSDALNPARIVAAPIYASGTGTLQVTVRAAMDPRTPMPAWPAPRPLTLDPAQHRPWVNVREYGRLWQIRMESNAIDTEWEVAAYGASVIPGGFAR